MGAGAGTGRRAAAADRPEVAAAGTVAVVAVEAAAAATCADPLLRRCAVAAAWARAEESTAAADAFHAAEDRSGEASKTAAHTVGAAGTAGAAVSIPDMLNLKIWQNVVQYAEPMADARWQTRDCFITKSGDGFTFWCKEC